MAEPAQQPVWVAPGIFPPKPESAPYGVIGEKGAVVGLATFEELAAHVAEARNVVAAIWTPASERTMPVEGEPRLIEALRVRDRRIAEVDLSNGKRSLVLFGAVFLWALLWSLQQGLPLWESQPLGLAGLLLLVMAVVPTYEAWKLRRESARLDERGLEAGEREARFEFWLARQRMPVTKVLLALILVVAAGQQVVGWYESIAAAGLVKHGEGRVQGYFEGAYWRLWTAPFLHGAWLHLALNGVALWFLGRRAEILARWPHLAMVFLTAAWAGGLASAHFMPDKPSVGASGGILGILGFLLVFETLHDQLVPRRARKRLLAAVILTFVVGAVAQAFIDNAAHAGGLAAGMIYAVLVFPKSSSPHRPRATKLDVVLGVVSLGLLTASALLALVLLLAW